MKKILASLVFWLVVAQLFAQTNPPARLALVAKSEEAASALDLLTAQLSGDNHFQLLERDEIDKVYHEQGLSAANRDDVKVGRILGADGLLLVDFKKAASTAHLNTPFGSSQRGTLTIRFIAVKPGVILTDGNFDWPPKDLASWAESTANYLRLFLPKLSVRAKDAIPISVVNLRSALQSSGELAEEHQLKLLTIQRLSQEPRFFVLEREKMQLLGEEKNLKSDESAFWDGSYLLEGTVDQNGYSKDIITINARLNPPKGGVPVLFEVSGSRTNLAEVINALAAKVASALNVTSSVKTWDSAEEAAQFFSEAKWALKWGVYAEAEAGADSAWALGKRDADCAFVRVNAYVMETSSEFIPIQDGIIYLTDGQPRSIGDEQTTNISITNAGAAFNKRLGEIDYSSMHDSPNPQGIETAMHALELYNEFSRSSTNGQPVVDSDWYKLGVEALNAASKILENFNLAPQAQKGVEDKLENLRSMVRLIDSLISNSPSVHDSYFGPNAALPADEFAGTFFEKPNFFLSELNWGCFWQETPRGEMALYENLMNSPVFGQIHDAFWFRSAAQPRLVAWNEADRQNLPESQKFFLREMDTSSNPMMRMEGKAVQLRDATSPQEAVVAITNLFETLIICRCAFITNHIDWRPDDLTQAIYGSRSAGSGAAEYVETPERDMLMKLCSSYSDRLRAEDDKGAKMLEEQKNSDVFEKQKQYLANLTPYNFLVFVKVFEQQNYTGAQAAELLPLIENYKSNLIARTPEPQKFKARRDVQFIDVFLESHVNQSPKPPASAPASTTAATPLVHSQPPSPVAAAPAISLNEPGSNIPTNILKIANFIKIPEQKETNDLGGDQIFAQRWSDGKLLFGLVHEKEVYDFDTNGNWIDSREASFDKIAIFNPTDESWSFIPGSEIPSGGITLTFQNENNRILLFNGHLFSSIDGPIKRFDFQTREWKTLDLPGQEGSDLYSVSGHLYAANSDTILEIKEDGSARILASTRRRPAVTSLDSLDNFAFRPFSNAPQLFTGPEQSLCASIGNDIYRWDGNDWQKILTMNISRPPEICDEAVIFRATQNYDRGDVQNLWTWDGTSSSPELCLSEKPKPRPGAFYLGVRKPDAPDLHPFWKSLPDDSLTGAAATFYHSNLYFFVEHVDVKNINGYWTAQEKDGYDAKLVCLSRDVPEPLVVPLEFDTSRGMLPIGVKPVLATDPSARNTGLHFSGDTLYLSHRSTLGVWTVSFSQIESAIAPQKKALLNQIAQAKAAQERIHSDLLMKYDLNHNGIIDPDEREAALDDPAFIESELDHIDTNHDGRLEAGELAWFDANQNKILDPKEQSGIDIAQHLLAVRLMKQCDADGKGYLTRNEFDMLTQSASTQTLPFAPFQMQSPGNASGRLAISDIENFLNQQTRRSLRLPGSTRIFFNQAQSQNWVPDSRQLFKAEVEYYWQHSGDQGN